MVDDERKWFRVGDLIQHANDAETLRASLIASGVRASDVKLQRGGPRGADGRGTMFVVKVKTGIEVTLTGPHAARGVYKEDAA